MDSADAVRALEGLGIVEQNRLCVIPPNKETAMWTIYSKFDESGYNDEIGFGFTLAEALEMAVAAVVDTGDVL